MASAYLYIDSLRKFELRPAALNFSGAEGPLQPARLVIFPAHLPHIPPPSSVEQGESPSLSCDTFLTPWGSAKLRRRLVLFGSVVSCVCVSLQFVVPYPDPRGGGSGTPSV